MTLKLHTIICSTRPGRRGPVVAQWFHHLARQHNGFDAALVDLAEVSLPCSTSRSIPCCSATGTVIPSAGPRA